jgi:dipeptidyl-peptidase-4
MDAAALAGLTEAAALQRALPEIVGVLADGAVLFRQAPARRGPADLYELAPSGAVAPLATAASLLGAAADAGGVTQAEASTDGRRVLVSAGGRAFLIERGPTPSPARELSLGSEATAPRLSPDGAHVAFVRAGALWVTAVPAGGAPDARARPRRLVPRSDGMETGVPELAARWSLGRDRGSWWSPDGRQLAFQRTDLRPVAAVPLEEPAGREVRYARAGEKLAITELGVVAIAGGAPRWITWDRTRYPYLARVLWPARGPLTLIVMSRAQTELAVLAADPRTGATTPLLVERDDAWVGLAAEPLWWLPDGSGFLWQTEAQGAYSLEHHRADGTHLRQVVPPAAGLRRVRGLTAAGTAVIFEGAADAREQHVWRAQLTGEPAVPLTPTAEGGVHHAVAAHGVTVLRSQLRGGGSAAVAVGPGDARRELPAVAERPRSPPRTTLETLTVETYTLNVAITRPQRYDPALRYPVVLFVDPGPQGKGVVDARDAYAVDQGYADAGFIALRIDGRGTLDRGREWARAIHGDVITLPMNDQIRALQKLGARHPQLDLARVGVVGDQVGGYFAVMAVLLHPKVFAAASATAPVTAWDQMEAAYAERYLRAPADNPEGYRRVSALTYVDRLVGPLRVVADPAHEWIHAAHSRALVDALTRAGKRVELAIAAPAAAHEQQLAFLRASLGPPTRPAKLPAPAPSRHVSREL